MTRALVVLALGLDLVLAVLLLRPEPTPVLFPLVPPLTRVSALRDHALGPPAPSPAMVVGPVIQAVGTPEQRAAATRLAERHRALGAARQGDPRRLRLELQADATALAAVLGPERVTAALARREELAARFGEGRLWDDAAQALRP